MSIKLILAPLDGSERSVQALRTAGVVAQRFGSHIKAVHVRERMAEPFLFSSLPSALKRDFEQLASSATRQMVATIEGQFASFLEESGIEATDGVVASGDATASLHLLDGDPGDVLNREGRLVDVITVARPEAHRVGGPAVGERLESLLVSTGRPVLIVPPDWGTRRANRAAIGWNDSAEAAHALCMTLPWLTQMDHVSVIAAPRRQESAERLVQYLALHDCAAEIQPLESRGGQVGERMLEVCRQSEVELLVVGGFSRTRARQRLFGGVTSHLLRNTDIATAMVH